MKYLLLLFLFSFITSSNFSYCQTSGNSPSAINQINDSTYILNNKVIINSKARTISLPAKVNMVSGAIEVVLCTKTGKKHESLFTTEVTPIELQTALLLLGHKSLKNRLSSNTKSTFNTKKKIKRADSVYIDIQWIDSGQVYTKRVESFIWNVKDSSYVKPVSWFFNGLLTNMEGKIICNDYVSMIVTYYDYYSILSLNLEARFDDDIYAARMDKKFLGKEINLIIRPIAAKRNFFRKFIYFIK